MKHPGFKNIGFAYVVIDKAVAKECYYKDRAIFDSGDEAQAFAQQHGLEAVVFTKLEYVPCGGHEFGRVMAPGKIKCVNCHRVFSIEEVKL